jgi:site-specific DNA-cytosine methylase
VDRPRLLDLFCGAGGAAMGYHRAGFEVVGVLERARAWGVRARRAVRRAN